MAFDPDLLIKMGDVREVIRDNLAGKITTIELIHILFELKKHAFPAADKTDPKKMPSLSTFTARCKQLEIDSAHNYAAQIIEAEVQKKAEKIIKAKDLRCRNCTRYQKTSAIKDRATIFWCPLQNKAVFGNDIACVNIDPRQDVIDKIEADGGIKFDTDGEVIP